ncbi:putative nucleic-acid-binding protein [Planktothrix serta PCC 8927]|uniref:Nucleic-acid-binding protein n=1 Tax=Planktothrix serta PCC 8927 TaxID=671068 RepID=A0A7Z9E4L9_9CYAN|nr:PIN domain-containing protein [Planktothrix serta]VXD22770.1 putative nucleic-acid-binding protein [Planktothrix serta PCC 8927]
MKNKVLLDTNLWVYLYSQNSPNKSVKVRELVNNNFTSIIVSTQILGEFYNVMTKKKVKPKDEVKQIILEMVTNFTIVEIDVLKVITALDINSKYGYTYWDSLVLATALQQNCNILYSEDMQANQLIEQKTIIINPFLVTQLE